MENNTLKRFMELLSVPSKTYHEDRMVNYLMGVISKMDGVSVYNDDYGNIYATKGILATGYYPMFIAHTDTVHEMVEEIIVVKTLLPKPNTFGMTFDPTVQHKSLKAITPDGDPTGIGGDDKCGIFICLELLEKLEYCKVGLFVSEETGCVGSSKCDVNFLNDVGYAVQFDAPGDALITELCSGVRLFEQNGEFINQVLPVIESAMGTKMFRQSHPYTDVSQIKKKGDFSCINISCGYYNMHTPNEFIVVEDVEKAIDAGLNIVEKLGYNKFEYSYEKPSHLQYGLFNLGDMGDEDEDDEMDNPPFDTDDFELDMDFNKAIYYEGLLSIIDKETNTSVVLTETEIEDLYNQLREVMTKRYWDY